MNAKIPLAVMSLLLGGCAASSYCDGDQKYEEAVSVAPIQSAEGLQLKESSSALKIPPPPEQPVRYGAKDGESSGAQHCLDQPPKLVLPEPKPGSDAPAAPAAPTDAPAEPPKT